MVKHKQPSPDQTSFFEGQHPEVEKDYQGEFTEDISLEGPKIGTPKRPTDYHDGVREQIDPNQLKDK